MKLIPLLTLLILSCQQPEQKTIAAVPANASSLNDSIPPKEIAGNFNAESQLKFDSTELNKFLGRYPAFKSYLADYQKFYGPRNYSYAWHNTNGMIEQSGILYSRIIDQKDNGINDSVPYFQDYAAMMEETSKDISPARELMLTGQYLVYARKVITGTSTDTRSIDWYIPRKKTDYASLLDTLLKGDTSMIGRLIFPQYYLLREKLQAYYAIEKKGSWVSIRTDKKKFQFGDSASEIKDIRKKLYLSGDINSDNGSAIFDSILFKGIQEFQRRYGLKEDGIAGSGVLKEMSAPLSKRIEQVLINMERCRWLPGDTEDNYLMVNIPQFKLLAVEKNKIAWSCNVVVGKETNETVIFKGDMKYVVFSPYWNVPPSIIKKEIQPGMKRNSNYLASHNMEWNDGKVRQKPGPNNSLGLVKFLFPNSYNIYLHDSPAKSLFNEDRRAFSHGCIRVGEPKRLAEYLLRDNVDWPKDKIWNAMNSGKEQYVTLNNTIPVYIVYLTAFVDDKGKLNFREDIYKRDEKLKAMMFTQKQ
jgi:murein L,D-transpeptidase YcbB/YkuD